MSPLLLDTHTLLWFLADDERLSSAAKEAIEDARQVLVSVGSLWEIAIKSSLGKLRLGKPFEEMFPEQLAANDLGLCAIEPRHLALVERLPMLHRDPFDRLLVAQAIVEDAILVSRDSKLAAFQVTVLW